MKKGFTFDEEFTEADEIEDMDQLRDDLESTKQLLELEVRSKKLLEKENNRMQKELEKLRNEMAKVGSSPGAAGGATSGSTTSNGACDQQQQNDEAVRARRSSVAEKRKSMIRLLSESDQLDVDPRQTMTSPMEVPEAEAVKEEPEEPPATKPKLTTAEAIEVAEDDDDEYEYVTDDEEEEDPEPEVRKSSESPTKKPETAATSAYEEEIIEEIEEMREEVDEARKLAEEWESKYKEMQRQMSEFENSRYKKHSLILDSASGVPLLQKMTSITSDAEMSFGKPDSQSKRWLNFLSGLILTCRSHRHR